MAQVVLDHRDLRVVLCCLEVPDHRENQEDL